MAEEEAGGGAPQAGVGSAALAGALGAAVNSTRVDELVDRQIALTNLQIDDMEKDNAVRSRTLRLVRFSALMKVAFEIFAAVVITVAVAAFLASVWSAYHAQGAVIEAFQVPPSLAEQGLTGQVIAARIQDSLTDMQAKTDSMRAPGSYQNNWGNDIKVQIPDTGVSVGEFNRYLRSLLGHETHITGEVWRTAQGISVAARAGTDTGAVFSGKESDLDTLLQKAAESIYAKTQPYRYAVYLGEQNRNAEAFPILKSLTETASPREQAWAYVDWGFAIFGGTRDWKKGRDLIALSAQRDPGNPDTYSSLSSVDGSLDREESQLQNARKALRLYENRREDFNPIPAETTRLNQAVYVDEELGDFQAARDLNIQVSRRPDFGGSFIGSVADLNFDFAALHDRHAEGVQEEKAREAAGKDLGSLAIYEVTTVIARTQLGDWRDAIKSHDALEHTLAAMKPGDADGYQVLVSRVSAAEYAYALAMSGDVVRAERVIDGTPPDCDTCILVRAKIAAKQKQWDRAAWWFARASAQAPSIPFPDREWGQMLLTKGDLDGAIAKFESAHRKGPHFADPLEDEGEALIAKNHSDLALAKFEEATKYAPNWARLHLKWGEALWWSGKRNEAKTQFAIAPALELAPAESIELQRMKNLRT